MPDRAIAALSLDDVSFIGSRLARPECVLCTRAGDVFAADRRGGVAHITPDGEQRLYGGATFDLSVPLFPNGVALDRDGSFLVTHLQDGDGGLFRVYRDGRVVPVLREVEGVRLHVSNFVLLDAKDRIWLTISTQVCPRIEAFRPDVADGYIVLIDRRGARVVADRLAFANECRIDPTGRWFYVNETCASRLTRYRVAESGDLSGRETITQFGPGEFPDGMAFDVEGGLWITSIVSNRLIRVDRDGRAMTLLEDSDPAQVAEVDAAFRGGRLDRALLERNTAKKLAHLSSIAFCGPQLDRACFGVIAGERLPTMPMPVRGVAPVHWEWT